MKSVAGLSVLALTAAAGTLIDLSQSQVVEASEPLAAATSLSPDAACARLGVTHLASVTISKAEYMAAGAAIPSAGLDPMYGKMSVVSKGLPAFCRIVGHIQPEQGSDIGFEVWLPSKGWDGRLHGIGIGGFAGAIDYFTLGMALKGGQAGVATDTGHSGGMLSSAWAKGNPQKVKDYGWRGVHLSTMAAKALISAYYGRGPAKSYFVGCSGGGRQGLMEAARFPEDYDGIVSGAPAANFTDLAIAFTNSIQAQLPPGAAIRPEQTGLLQEEVLRQCDAADGQQDGLVGDPRQCRFDASRLSCRNTSSAQCFTDAQINALNRIHLGARTSGGAQLTAGYLPSGSEVGSPALILGWEGYQMQGGKGPSGSVTLVSGMLGDLVQHPFATPATFNFDRDPAKLRAVSGDLDVPTDLKRFFARGGKLIMWHGWADAAIPPGASLKYYEDMFSHSGRLAKDAVRLFMVPGVQHCMGGLGPDAFGQSSAPQSGDTPERSMVAALQAWVEGTRPAPDTLVGRRGHGAPGSGLAPERQRLLCAWPKKAQLRPGANPDQAEGYVCT